MIFFLKINFNIKKKSNFILVKSNSLFKIEIYYSTSNLFEHKLAKSITGLVVVKIQSNIIFNFIL